MSSVAIGGGIVLVDDADEAVVLYGTWAVSRCNGKLYVKGRRRKVGPETYLHRVLLDAPADVVVDHVNGNGLDNRRSNIRLCTTQENARNTRYATGISGLRGVALHKSSGLWRALITVSGRQISLGYFHDKEEAARAYDAAAIERFGEFARLNYPVAKEA